MANIIKPKRSNTAAKVPTTTELISGELGVNMADRKVYINNGTAVVQVGAGNLSGLGDVAIATPTNGQALTYNSTTSKWVNSSAGTGTVTSVGITPGTGVTVSGSPVTTSGNIAVGLSTKLTAIEDLSGAGFITQNGTGVIAARTLQAGTGISIQHGNGSSQDPIITNSAPDQTVALTGDGATTITGTYPNFTITSVNTTYSTATSTVPGLIELASDTEQTVAANSVSDTASRTYGLQLNAAGQGVVNVPWTDTVYSLPAATSTVRGGIELGSDTAQTVASNAVTATASRSYALQVNAAGQGVVNVPWTDTVYSLPAATSTIRGGIELGSDTAQTVAANAVSATASRSYALQVNAAGQGVVNVPWTDTNSGGTVTSITAGSFLTGGVITTTGTIAVDATSANTASKVVARDASGNFSAGIITTAGRQENYGTTTDSGTIAGITGGTSGGTIAVPTQTLSGTTLYKISSLGYTGTAWTGGAKLEFVATENITATNRGTNAVLSAIAAGGAVATSVVWNGSTLVANGTTLTGNTGTVTSVTGTGTVSGLSLSGTVTASGNLTLGGTLAVTPSNFASQTANTFLAAPNGAAGVPTFRAMVAADVPTLNQNTTGSAATLTTGRTIAMTGDVTYTSGSFNGSANVTGTATLANSGVTAGTYTKVTVNAKGLTTSGTTLAASDIPELTMAKLPGAAYKESVRCATTANITLSGTQTIDGIAVVANDRVLVKNQTTASQNGIYVVAAGAWTRSLDADAASEIGAAVVNVDSGTTNGGELWTTTFKTTDTLGTTAMNWYEVLYNTGSWGISITGSSASTTGNAATATALQTARTIGGVSFNGTANINLPGVNTAGNQNTSGTAAVSTAATITTSTTSSAFKVPFANTTASTTGNYSLLQDSTATFTYNPSTNTLAVGTVSGALSGNAATATTATNVSGGTASVTTLTVNSNNISAVNSLGFRNRIINGDMRIDQRNAGASVTINAYGYGVDRWGYQCFGGGAWSSQRTTIVPAGFTNSLGLTVTTADASIGASDVYQLFQKIEGFNTADLGWGTASAQAITVSFWVRSSVTGTYCASFINNAFNRTYAATFTVSAANTWEFKTLTIPGDTSGTWATDNSIGIQLGIDLGSGSNQNVTAGSWATTSGVSTARTSGSVNWIATNGATFYITGVQLEAGTVASPFERRDYGRELMMCQRYYQTLRGLFSIVGGYATVTQQTWMRTLPTVTTFGAYAQPAPIVVDATPPNLVLQAATGSAAVGFAANLSAEL